jgi:hypothetical protein
MQPGFFTPDGKYLNSKKNLSRFEFQNLFMCFPVPSNYGWLRETCGKLYFFSNVQVEETLLKLKSRQ